MFGSYYASQQQRSLRKGGKSRKHKSLLDEPMHTSFGYERGFHSDNVQKILYPSYPTRDEHHEIDDPTQHIRMGDPKELIKRDNNQHARMQELKRYYRSPNLDPTKKRGFFPPKKKTYDIYRKDGSVPERRLGKHFSNVDQETMDRYANLEKASLKHVQKFEERNDPQRQTNTRAHPPRVRKPSQQVQERAEEFEKNIRDFGGIFPIPKRDKPVGYTFVPEEMEDVTQHGKTPKEFLVKPKTIIRDHMRNDPKAYMHHDLKNVSDVEMVQYGSRLPSVRPGSIFEMNRQMMESNMRGEEEVDTPLEKSLFRIQTPRITPYEERALFDQSKQQFKGDVKLSNWNQRATFLPKERKEHDNEYIPSAQIKGQHFLPSERQPREMKTRDFYQDVMDEQHLFNADVQTHQQSHKTIDQKQRPISDHENKDIDIQHPPLYVVKNRNPVQSKEREMEKFEQEFNQEEKKEIKKSRREIAQEKRKKFEPEQHFEFDDRKTVVRKKSIVLESDRKKVDNDQEIIHHGKALSKNKRGVTRYSERKVQDQEYEYDIDQPSKSDMKKSSLVQSQRKLKDNDYAFEIDDLIPSHRKRLMKDYNTRQKAQSLDSVHIDDNSTLGIKLKNRKSSSSKARKNAENKQEFLQDDTEDGLHQRKRNNSLEKNRKLDETVQELEPSTDKIQIPKTRKNILHNERKLISLEDVIETVLDSKMSHQKPHSMPQNKDRVLENNNQEISIDNNQDLSSRHGTMVDRTRTKDDQDDTINVGENNQHISSGKRVVDTSKKKQSAPHDIKADVHPSSDQGFKNNNREMIENSRLEGENIQKYTPSADSEKTISAFRMNQDKTFLPRTDSTAILENLAEPKKNGKINSIPSRAPVLKRNRNKVNQFEVGNKNGETFENYKRLTKSEKDAFKDYPKLTKTTPKKMRDNVNLLSRNTPL